MTWLLEKRWVRDRGHSEESHGALQSAVAGSGVHGGVGRKQPMPGLCFLLRGEAAWLWLVCGRF